MVLLLDEIPEYSEENTVAAFCDYIEFLTKLYLDESLVEFPPTNGWPDITQENFRYLGKSDKVISLLRKLPYIKTPENSAKAPDACTSQRLVNWNEVAHEAIRTGPETVEDWRIMTEDVPKSVPPSVVGIAISARDGTQFYLDTELGLIYWLGCPGGIWENTDLTAIHEYVDSGPHEDYEDEFSEASWRDPAISWSIEDFFGLLKTLFLRMDLVPIDSREVMGSRDWGEEEEATYRGILRLHGWPDLDRYEKAPCLQALENHYDELCASRTRA